MLFNIAAMSTMIAEAQNLDSEDGLQKANKKLQVRVFRLDYTNESRAVPESNRP